jgi:hypothetical protein
LGPFRYIGFPEEDGYINENGVESICRKGWWRRVPLHLTYFLMFCVVPGYADLVRSSGLCSSWSGGMR